MKKCLQGFTIHLNTIWGDRLNYRLYFALVATEEICSDMTGFIGCMSFSMEELLAREGPWPNSWWMLPQTVGLFGHEAVEKVVSPDEMMPGSVTHIIIAGRSQANMMVSLVLLLSNCAQ